VVDAGITGLGPAIWEPDSITVPTSEMCALSRSLAEGPRITVAADAGSAGVGQYGLDPEDDPLEVVMARGPDFEREW
jgi:hypothetical protein